MLLLLLGTRRLGGLRSRASILKGPSVFGDRLRFFLDQEIFRVRRRCRAVVRDVSLTRLNLRLHLEVHRDRRHHEMFMVSKCRRRNAVSRPSTWHSRVTAPWPLPFSCPRRHALHPIPKATFAANACRNCDPSDCLHLGSFPSPAGRFHRGISQVVHHGA